MRKPKPIPTFLAASRTGAVIRLQVNDKVPDFQMEITHVSGEGFKALIELAGQSVGLARGLYLGSTPRLGF